MTKINIKTTVESLIDTFLKAGKISLELRKKGLTKKLKNDKDYYGEFGKQYLSNSDIKSLTTKPSKFHAPVKTTQAMTEGRYFHQLILEKSKAKKFPIVDSSTRATKIFKEYCEENGYDKNEVLLQKEADSIQEMVDGSALKLTTARYYTPNGRHIHDNGIEPDVVVEYEELEVPKVALPEPYNKDNQIIAIIDDINTKLTKKIN